MKPTILLATLAVASLTAAPAAALPDVIRQDLSLDLTGSTLRVEIDAIIAVEAGDDALPIYTLGVAALVIEANGAPATLESDPRYDGLVQWLSLPADSAGLVDVHMVLEGPPACRSALRPGMDACTWQSEERFLPPAEPGAAWYLTNLFTTDPFAGSVIVRAPEGLEVTAGQGAPTHVSAEGDVVERRFDLVVETELLFVHARHMALVEETAGDGTKVTGGVATEAARAPMARMVETAARVLPLYAEMFGALPLDEIHLLPVSGRFPFGGLGLLGDIVLGDFITLPAFDYLLVQGAAHELAHSWWGGMTSAVDPAEGGFLQEAFAEYSAWRALGAADEAVRTSGARMNAVWYMTQVTPSQDAAILDVDDPDVYILVTYHKGSVVLRTLAERVGEDLFTDALAALVARGPGRLTVAGLLEEIRDVSGLDLEQDASQWLERPGFPVVRVGVQVGVEVGVEVGVQGTSLSADVSGSFAIDLPLRIVTSDGAVEERLLPRGAQALPLDPRTVLVEVDPRWTLVRKVEPALFGDVSLDGRVDAVDLMEVALRAGGRVPDERRQDGGYDPLYDLNDDGRIDAADLDVVAAAAAR
jgi:hypothetical protein